MESLISQIKQKPQASALTWMADFGRCHEWLIVDGDMLHKFQNDAISVEIVR